MERNELAPITRSDDHARIITMMVPSGRLTISNVATWVLSDQDSNTAPQTSQDT